MGAEHSDTNQTSTTTTTTNTDDHSDHSRHDSSTRIGDVSNSTVAGIGSIGGDLIFGASAVQSRASRQNAAPPPSPKILGKPWRDVRWRFDFQREMRNYTPVGASHVRVLLYGPAGAGKSSFINSVNAAITGGGLSAATQTNPLQYSAHPLTTKIVFNEIMGLKAGDSMAVLADDVKLAMEGHVKDGYNFQPFLKLSQDNAHYKSDPTIDDKVHVLVCVLNANAPNVDNAAIQRMKEIVDTAKDLGIPQFAVATHIDEVSAEIAQDVKNVYKSKELKKRMEMFSSTVGIDMMNIFAVRNNYRGDQKKEVEALLLTSLNMMKDYGDEFIGDNPDSPTNPSQSQQQRHLL